MSSLIRHQLAYLYGDHVARDMAPRVQGLVNEHRSRPSVKSRRPPPARLSERDCLLITYGDQVREPDIAPLRSLAEFAENHLSGVISGIHILPFYPYSSDDGFSVKDYYEVDPALGSWDDIQRLGTRFDLMFDAVFNHMSAQSEWFEQFLRGDPRRRDFFVQVEGNPDLSPVVRPRALPLLTEFETVSGVKKVWTTFSADQVDLDARNPEVLLALLEVLLFYVAQGARFIRLDAIAYLWKEIGTPCIHLPQTHRIIQLMRSVLDEIAPPVLLITETNVPHADNVSYFGDGTNEAQLVYNFALPPLVLHSIATGNAGKLTRWAQSLALPSNRVTFFSFLASHDGIGINPARGILSQPEIDALVERTQAHGGFVSWKYNADGSKSPYELNINYFDALSNPVEHEPIETQVKRFMVAQAVMLSLTGVPGIYFHSLFGSRNDRAGAEASGIPRRVNRQKFTRAELDTDLNDPASLRSRVLGEFTKRMQRRRSNPAFDPMGEQEILSLDERLFAVRRRSSDGQHQALCLHNLGGSMVSVSVDGSDHTLGAYEVEWIQERPGNRPP